MAMESLPINIARKTWEPSDDEACVVFKDPSTMAPAIPGVAADIPGNGTPPSMVPIDPIFLERGRWVVAQLALWCKG